MTTKKRTINELRQTKDSYYVPPFNDETVNQSEDQLIKDAKNFLYKNYFSLKTDLNSENYNSVISALVSYRKINDSF